MEKTVFELRFERSVRLGETDIGDGRGRALDRGHSWNQSVGREVFGKCERKSQF